MTIKWHLEPPILHIKLCLINIHFAHLHQTEPDLNITVMHYEQCCTLSHKRFITSVVLRLTFLCWKRASCALSVPLYVCVSVTLTGKAKLHWVPASTVLSLAFVEAFTTGLLLLFPLFLLLLHSPQPTHCWLHMQTCTLMHACTQPNPYAHTTVAYICTLHNCYWAD